MKQLDGQELLGHRVTLSSYVSLPATFLNFALTSWQGKKTLKEAHARSSRSRSPIASKDVMSGVAGPPARSRSPVPATNRPVHFRGRSRSPFEMSRHSNAPQRHTCYPPRRHDHLHDSSRKFYPNGHNTAYPPRHDKNHTRFSTEESAYERMPSHSRSPTRTRRAPDYYDDLSYMSDERRLRIDRLADEWSSYNRMTPSRF